jgi:thioredoxin-dependent peroxiredoxin
MSEPPKRRAGVVTLQGRPVTLLGDELRAGNRAPDFTAVATDFSPVTLASSAGTVRLLSVLPSLDTEVCDRQTRRFNAAAAKIDGVTVWTVSVDLPFTQQRWCGAAGLDGIKMISDFQDRSFGLAYGVAIAEFRLLARAVFIVDAEDRVTYVEYVREVGQHPNYEVALEAATEATQRARVP